MRKVLFAALFASVATTAVAADVSCVMEDRKGNDIRYSFTKLPDGDWLETEFAKNFGELNHRPSNRPIWEISSRGDILIARYSPDMRYRIEVDTARQKNFGRDMAAASALLISSEQGVLARGACGVRY